MRRVATGLAAAAMLALSWGSAQAEPPPLAAYGALPAMTDVTISPDGSQLAYIAVTGEQRTLVAQTLEGKALGMVNVGDAKVRSLQWAGPDSLIIVTSATGSSPYFLGRHEWLFATSYNLRKRRFIDLASHIPETMNVLLSDPVVRFAGGRWVAIISTVSLKESGVVLREASLETPFARRLEALNDKAGSWLLDENGVMQAQTRYDNYARTWSLHVRRGAGWPSVYSVKTSIDTPDLVSFGRDGKSPVLAITDDDRDVRFVEITEAGEQRSPMPAGHDFHDVLVDPLTQRLIGGVYQKDYLRYAFFDAKDQAAWDRVTRAFEGQRAQLSSWTDDRRKAVVWVEGPKNSGAYYLIDFNTGKADIIGEAYPGVKAQDVAEIRPFTYQAADGLKIPGYLTLPVGKTPRNLPLIVFAHGGPASHDQLTFDWWGQALASRGYAVLQPNFRGSTGYGAAHLKAGYGEWGRKMQTDLSDGVRTLAAEGLIDPKRVCIVGGSYGGYAAMAGPTIDLGVYRCAVAVAGVSDLRLMLASEKSDAGSRDSTTTRYWRRFMGAKSDKDPALDAISPARLADRLDAPILLIHGKDDTVVPYNQSLAFQAAARRAGRPVDLVALEGEDHWLSRSDTRLRMLEATVAFLEKHNPPD